MHPHQDICPYDGCGRTHFVAPDALALHCWHVHGLSVLDISVIQCTRPGCEMLRFEHEGHLMEHMYRVHRERISLRCRGSKTGRLLTVDRNGRLKRPRIRFGRGYTDDEIFIYAPRQIYYENEKPPDPEELPHAHLDRDDDDYMHEHVDRDDDKGKEDMYDDDEPPPPRPVAKRARPRARSNGYNENGADD